jgi:hypothetical protein
VTSAEQGAINNGITSKTQSLTTAKNSKIAAVNALTTIAAVIAYDVTAGWPSVPTPPGYGPIAPATYRAEEYVTMTVPTPTGGIPEAPTDGLMYGRQSAAWHRSLAITADLLDGGNF